MDEREEERGMEKWKWPLSMNIIELGKIKMINIAIDDKVSDVGKERQKR